MAYRQWQPRGLVPYSHSAAIFLLVPHQKNILLLLFRLEGVQGFNATGRNRRMQITPKSRQQIDLLSIMAIP